MKKQPHNLIEDSGEVNPLNSAMEIKFSPLSESFAGLAEYSQKRKAGRPKKANPKVEVKLRIAPEVLNAFKAMGKGWQTRMNEVLKASLESA